MKKIYPVSLLLFLFFIFPNFHYGQDLFRNYTSLSYNKNLIKNDEATTKVIAKQEKQIARFIRFGDWQLQTIPVVVHVLYANEREKISAEQIERQIEALNNHFSLAEKIENHANDPDGIYAQRAVDTKIRFCLASQTEAGRPMEGIEYVETKVTLWEDLNEIKKNKDGANPANQNKFLNIWVAHLPDDNAGFAQMPNRKTNTDGIVIDYRYFGFTDHPQYGGAKTLTFLVAQFLGLYPLFGYDPDRPCTDDFVADTPRHNSINRGCPSYEHVSLCDKSYVPEMTMNFLSGTDDDCKYMFTRNQAARMQAVLDATGARGSLTDWKFNHCESIATDEANISKNILTSNSLINEDKLLVYPNPVANQLFIEWHTKDAVEDLSIEVLSTDGKIIATQKITTTGQVTQHSLDVSGWLAGFYLVKVISPSNTIVQKITIE